MLSMDGVVGVIVTGAAGEDGGETGCSRRAVLMVCRGRPNTAAASVDDSPSAAGAINCCR